MVKHKQESGHDARHKGDKAVPGEGHVERHEGLDNNTSMENEDKKVEEEVETPAEETTPESTPENPESAPAEDGDKEDKVSE